MYITLFAWFKITTENSVTSPIFMLKRSFLPSPFGVKIFGRRIVDSFSFILISGLAIISLVEVVLFRIIGSCCSIFCGPFSVTISLFISILLLCWNSEFKSDSFSGVEKSYSQSTRCSACFGRSFSSFFTSSFFILSESIVIILCSCGFSFLIGLCSRFSLFIK